MVRACMCRPIIEFNTCRSWFPPHIGGLSACMGNVVHSSTYTTGTRALPDIYAQARGRVRIYQAKHSLGPVRIYQAKHSSLWYKYNIKYNGQLIFTVKRLRINMRSLVTPQVRGRVIIANVILWLPIKKCGKLTIT